MTEAGTSMLKVETRRRIQQSEDVHRSLQERRDQEQQQVIIRLRIKPRKHHHHDLEQELSMPVELEENPSKVQELQSKARRS
jgi:hypothetical protein